MVVCALTRPGVRRADLGDIVLPILMLFVGGLLAETWLLIEIGGQIGGLATIGICVATGFIGGNIARWQGMNTLRRGLGGISGGELPTGEVVNGVFILIAGVLLLTPGYLSDTVGFLLLTPPIRGILRPRAIAWAKEKVRVARSGGKQSGFRWNGPGPGPGFGGPGPNHGRGPSGFYGGGQAESGDSGEDVILLPPGDRPTPPSKKRGPVTIIESDGN